MGKEVLMNPADLIPTPDAIPVHWIWFQLLLFLTLFIHIVLMNIMLGTVVIAFCRHFHNPESSCLLTREISKKLPFTIALAVNFGVAPLLFVQVLYGHFIYVSSILMATLWIAIIDILILAYYTAYIYRYKYQTLEYGRPVATGLISSLLLLIAFLFSNNFTLMLHPATWPQYFTHPAAMLLNTTDPTLVPRYLHFVCSSLAIGGLAIAVFFNQKKYRQQAESRQWVRYGCNWFAYATFVNFAIGFWFFGSLPAGLIKPTTLVGAIFSIALVLGVITALLGVIHAVRLKILSAVSLIAASIFSMMLARELLRVAYLSPYFSLADLKIVPAYSPFALFLLFFIGGIGLIGWMLKTAWQSLNRKEVEP